MADITGKILVVDDEEKNLRLIEAMLVPMGHSVIFARDGTEALEKAEETEPDLILLDIMMPGMDGFETAVRLRERETAMAVPIIMVTALHEMDDRFDAFDAGADDFITKPFTKTQLRVKVQSMLKARFSRS